VTINERIGLCEENNILFLKSVYEFEGFGASRLMKEFIRKGRKKTTLNDF